MRAASGWWTLEVGSNSGMRERCWRDGDATFGMLSRATALASLSTMSHDECDVTYAC